jgi:SP family facilitated glucose transporter-like MFS transporter 8
LLKIREAGDKDNSMDENFGAVIISFVRILGSGLSTLLMISVGRRCIALISGAGTTISALTLGVVLILQSIGNISFGSDWLTFTLTVLFIWFHSFGFYLLPVLMIGETQAAHVRGFACGYIYTVNDLVLGGALKFYHSLLRTLEIHGLFFLFGISCLICTIFVYFFLPETQGRTLEQIEDYFHQPHVMWVTRNKCTQSERNCGESTTEETTVLDK